ncbi:protein FAR-RED IMPAIRED RESPONSE 1-like [Quercus suber]|uniref:protein FAR-RED IMPAIRED RESPONSE 1-like n=1 Tax=Quercus suber TaxID=58331 RepID=UPI000CE24370|nr:protein FAR-RED IMPAIRED RESPONSE 1-like [Quercus suber]
MDANEDLSPRFMDVNEDLSPRVMDVNEDLSPKVEVHAELIELACSSGIKPKASHELMSREAGGRADFGFIELDRMIIDNDNFGDVVAFDTTYGTNKELRPLGVFTGFNRHRGLMVFGAALLYDEMVDSFKLLFESFLVAHAGKKPKAIFTDQDPAMAKTLNEVMPNTYH